VKGHSKRVANFRHRLPAFAEVIEPQRFLLLIPSLAFTIVRACLWDTSGTLFEDGTTHPRSET
jgi:hypothetical protein